MREFSDVNDFDMRQECVDSLLNQAKAAHAAGDAVECRKNLDAAHRLHECNKKAVEFERLFQQ